MGKIWFTSDLHLGHDRDFCYGERGFENVDIHDYTIVQNFNSLVSEDDEVYILGDLLLGAGVERSLKYISKLKGHKHLIIGNHDGKLLEDKEAITYFETVSHYMEIIDDIREE